MSEFEDKDAAQADVDKAVSAAVKQQQRDAARRAAPSKAELQLSQLHDDLQKETGKTSDEILLKKENFGLKAQVNEKTEKQSLRRQYAKAKKDVAVSTVHLSSAKATATIKQTEADDATADAERSSIRVERDAKQLVNSESSAQAKLRANNPSIKVTKKSLNKLETTAKTLSMEEKAAAAKVAGDANANVGKAVTEREQTVEKQMDTKADTDSKTLKVVETKLATEEKDAANKEAAAAMSKLDAEQLELAAKKNAEKLQAVENVEIEAQNDKIAAVASKTMAKNKAALATKKAATDLKLSKVALSSLKSKSESKLAALKDVVKAAKKKVEGDKIESAKVKKQSEKILAGINTQTKEAEDSVVAARSSELATKKEGTKVRKRLNILNSQVTVAEKEESDLAGSATKDKNKLRRIQELKAEASDAKRALRKARADALTKREHSALDIEAAQAQARRSDLEAIMEKETIASDQVVAANATAAMKGAIAERKETEGRLTALMQDLSGKVKSLPVKDPMANAPKIDPKNRINRDKYLATSTAYQSKLKDETIRRGITVQKQEAAEEVYKFASAEVTKLQVKARKLSKETPAQVDAHKELIIAATEEIKRGKGLLEVAEENVAKATKVMEKTQAKLEESKKKQGFWEKKISDDVWKTKQHAHAQDITMALSMITGTSYPEKRSILRTRRINSLKAAIKYAKVLQLNFGKIGRESNSVVKLTYERAFKAAVDELNTSLKVDVGFVFDLATQDDADIVAQAEKISDAVAAAIKMAEKHTEEGIKFNFKYRGKSVDFSKKGFRRWRTAKAVLSALRKLADDHAHLVHVQTVGLVAHKTVSMNNERVKVIEEQSKAVTRASAKAEETLSAYMDAVSDAVKLAPGAKLELRYLKAVKKAEKIKAKLAATKGDQKAESAKVKQEHENNSRLIKLLGERVASQKKTRAQLKLLSKAAVKALQTVSEAHATILKGVKADQAAMLLAKNGKTAEEKAAKKGAKDATRKETLSRDRYGNKLSKKQVAAVRSAHRLNDALERAKVANDMHAVAAEKWKAESTTLNKAKQLKKRQATILKKLKGFVAQVEQGTLKVMIAKQNLVHAQLLDAKNITHATEALTEAEKGLKSVKNQLQAIEDGRIESVKLTRKLKEYVRAERKAADGYTQASLNADEAKYKVSMKRKDHAAASATLNTQANRVTEVAARNAKKVASLKKEYDVSKKASDKAKLVFKDYEAQANKIKEDTAKVFDIAGKKKQLAYLRAKRERAIRSAKKAQADLVLATVKASKNQMDLRAVTDQVIFAAKANALSTKNHEEAERNELKMLDKAKLVMDKLTGAVSSMEKKSGNTYSNTYSNKQIMKHLKAEMGLKFQKEEVVDRMGVARRDWLNEVALVAKEQAAIDIKVSMAKMKVSVAYEKVEDYKGVLNEVTKMHKSVTIQSAADRKRLSDILNAIINKKANIESALLDVAHTKATLAELVDNHTPTGADKNPSSIKVHGVAVKRAERSFAHAQKLLAHRRMSFTNQVNYALTGTTSGSGDSALSIRTLEASIKEKKILLQKMSDNISVVRKKWGMAKDANTEAVGTYSTQFKSHPRIVNDMKVSEAALKDQVADLALAKEAASRSRALVFADKLSMKAGKAILWNRQQVFNYTNATEVELNDMVKQCNKDVLFVQKFKDLQTAFTKISKTPKALRKASTGVDNIDEQLQNKIAERKDSITELRRSLSRPSKQALIDATGEYKEKRWAAETALEKQKEQYEVCAKAEQAVVEELK